MAFLTGQRVLVVEDEPLISMDIAQAITQSGGEVVGPALTLSAAEDLAGKTPITAALLDVRLSDEVVSTVAAMLASRRIPFVFYTGTTSSDAIRAWPDAIVVSKPSSSSVLVEALADAIAGRRIVAG